MASLHAFNIPLFRALFKGRDDVFAIRWEKGNKNGYIPAYQYDPYLYRQHKIGGGTFQNFNAKSYLPLTDNQIEKHLNGGQQAGPLLPDNCSWLLVADEATYIWHVPKDKLLLRESSKRIEQHLSIIRQQGRQYFLDTSPTDFSRLVHDYSDGVKGFIIWKDMVEERLE